MPAIRPHSTGTSDATWDGPGNEARLRSDEDLAYYSRAYAWRDPEGDEGNKSTYRFIHHFVDGDGNPGDASIRACITGIGVLNGARGGTTIPDADRRGVWRHLARHLEDAGLEPPELQERSAVDRVERRSCPVEVRVEDVDGGTPKIVGHAAVFDELSVPLGWGRPFRERIRQGAFRKTLKERADVRALWNHNPDWVLGRTKSGTLQLAEDERGLAVEITPPETQWASDLMVSMKRGDVNQMSFGFEVVREEWGSDNGEQIRELVEVKLFDVSVVTFPAYEGTDVQVRSALESLRASIEALQRQLPTAPPPAGHPEGDGQTTRLAVMRRRLKLVELGL